jgi:hypothetical protein
MTDTYQTLINKCCRYTVIYYYCSVHDKLNFIYN